MKKEVRSKKIREGDNVVILAGNCKGQTGTVLRFVKNGVVVQGINIKKKHVKRSEQNPQGGVVELEKPIHTSNVSVCDENGKRLKLKCKVEGQEKSLVDQSGKTYRTLKKS